MPAPSDPRQVRLQNEWQRLQKLNEESDTVRVEPVDWDRSGPPEKYLVTFRCRGIVGIDGARSPVFGTEHRVRMECHESFPMEPPALRWETPIWHPNIQHREPKGVCVNKPEWLGGQTLVDLCRMMFEMVQYRNYHAISGQKPYPLDGVVAEWVRDVGEPRGFVNKARSVFVDDKPFTRPTVPSRINVAAGGGGGGSPRIKLVASSGAATATQTPTQAPTRIRVKAPGT